MCGTAGLPALVEANERVEPTIRTDGDSFAVSAAPDRATVAVSEYADDSSQHGIVVLYDGLTGQQLGRIDGSLFGVAIPGGELVGATIDGNLTVYDADTLAPIRDLAGSRGYVQTMDSSADGHTLLAKGGDHSASLYDLDSGVRLGDPLVIPAADVNAAHLRSDGLEMAVGGGERGIAMWDLDPARWTEAACALTGRNLTPQEWSTYIADLGPYRITCPQYPAGS